MIKKQALKYLIYTFAFLLMGSVLVYPVVSFEAATPPALPNSSASMLGNAPTITPSTNVECKKITINKAKYVTENFTLLGMNIDFMLPATMAYVPTCPSGYVPGGLHISNLAQQGNATTSNCWITDISGWGVVTAYSPYYPYSSNNCNLNYNMNDINYVVLVCYPRTISFTAGPCTQ